ncbi:PREDICTED: neuropeptide Y receptor-like isoform X3 [Nicrophorus vespilloides]|uniref:Neuropeptide Y receptor-like isoform X3 n=1 Tax=Nicrophorus vespilloides TaxID=110193 RepID=A0ABM1M845_NICVS|nr:PREDICTED: neuropeptide Y receptor-like isoform X3 [Nicrophorus vespilloides]XP_017770745.1 PREDICTED: neuropeptide Y receptor-like isoform X3 [Nicrophorus vespilloides]
MMITVVVVYTICWLPLNLIWLIADNYEVDERLMTYLWFSSHWFAMSHTCYNPIIYCYMNSRFRTCFFQVLSSVPCLRQCCATRILHRPSTSFPLTSKSMRRRGDGQYIASSKQHLYNLHQHEAEEWQ